MRKVVACIVLCAVMVCAAAAFAAEIPSYTTEERHMLSHAIIDVPTRAAVGDGKVDAEPFVSIQKYDPDILLGGRAVDLPFIRDSLAKKYADINAKLKPMGLTLKIVFGYRTLELQTQYHEGTCLSFIKEWTAAGNTYTGSEFTGRDLPDGAGKVTTAGGDVSKTTDPKKFNDMDLHVAADPYAAYQPIAGHPTGGATDTRIARLDTGEELSFSPSTENVTLEEEAAIMSTFGLYSNSMPHPGITDEMFANRMLLHNLMVEAGFAPFYGEWWHFMYGDKEWAAFTGKSQAIYKAPEVSLTSNDVLIEGLKSQKVFKGDAGILIEGGKYVLKDPVGGKKAIDLQLDNGWSVYKLLGQTSKEGWSAEVSDGKVVITVTSKTEIKDEVTVALRKEADGRYIYQPLIIRFK